VPAIPAAIALELTHTAAGIVFAASALGVIPTAALMGRATEEVAAQSGPGIGGLLAAIMSGFLQNNALSTVIQTQRPVMLSNRDRLQRE
jgi:calcium/proton exchanger cax